MYVMNSFRVKGEVFFGSINIPTSLPSKFPPKPHRPKHYLFEGQKRAQYSVKSIQEVTKKYAFEAQIRKKVTPHILRHSYATHQLENGVNIRYIQELLGHHSIKTTEIYTHISKVAKEKIANPLDQL